MSLRHLLFGRPRPDSNAFDLGLLLFRLIAGLALAFLHGLGKVPPSEGFVGMLTGMGMPAPGLAAWLAAAAEFGGGLLLAVGLLTRPVSLFMLGHFTVVLLVAHAGDPLADRELPLLFWAVALHFLLTGPGRYSIDAALAGQRR